MSTKIGLKKIINDLGTLDLGVAAATWKGEVIVTTPALLAVTGAAQGLIVDGNSRYTATNIEDALQEVKALADSNSLGLGAFWAQVDVGTAPVADGGSGDITLSGEQTIDGVLTSTSRVIVGGQTDKSENGIYTTNAGAWTRTADADADAEFSPNKTVQVAGGTLFAGTTVAYTGAATPTLGTDDITFARKASSSLADGSVTAAKLATNAVTSVKLADHAVTRAKLGLASVGTDELGTAAVTASKIGLLAVETQHMNNLAITGAKIANNTISFGKLDPALQATIDSINPDTGRAGAFTHPIRALSASPITVADISAGSTIDGVVLVAGDAILLAAQANSVENGVYTVGTGAGSLSRHSAFDQATEVKQWMTFGIGNGSVFSGTQVSYIGPDSPVVGGDQLAFMPTNDTVDINSRIGTNATSIAALSAQIGIGVGQSSKYIKNIAYSGTTAIGTLPANSVVLRTLSYIKVPFNGATPGVQVGTPTSVDRFYKTGDIDMKDTGATTTTDTVSMETSGSVVNAIIDESGGNDGEILVIVEYI